MKRSSFTAMQKIRYALELSAVERVIQFTLKSLRTVGFYHYSYRHIILVYINGEGSALLPVRQTHMVGIKGARPSSGRHALHVAYRPSFPFSYNSVIS